MFRNGLSCGHHVSSGTGLAAQKRRARRSGRAPVSAQLVSQAEPAQVSPARQPLRRMQQHRQRAHGRPCLPCPQRQRQTCGARSRPVQAVGRQPGPTRRPAICLGGLRWCRASWAAMVRGPIAPAHHPQAGPRQVRSFGGSPPIRAAPEFMRSHQTTAGCVRSAWRTSIRAAAYVWSIRRDGEAVGASSAPDGMPPDARAFKVG